MRRLFRPVPLAVIASTLLLVYTLAGFFLLPYIIKSHVIPSVAEQLHRPVLVEDVEVNPFALSLRVIGFEIREPDQSPMIGFEEFYINLQTISLFRQAYVFDAIRLVLPYVSAKVSKAGRLNLVDLLPPGEEPEPAAPPQAEKIPSQVPAVEIREFEIAQGVVEFRDESKPEPYVLEIVPIHIALKNFYTKPGGDNSYAFTAELGKGETLAWEGTISLEPIRSEGTLSLRGVKLATFWNYVRDQYNFDLTAGTLQAKGRYRFDAATSPPDFRMFEAGLHLSDIQLNEKGEADPIKVVPTLDVEGFDLDFHGRRVAIESVVMADGTDRVWINPDKSVNFATIFNPVKTNSTAEPLPSSPSSASAVPGEQGGGWTVLLKDAHVTNHTIHFEDRSLALPMRTEVTGLSAKTHDFVFPFKGPIPLTVQHKLNETGTVSVDGQIVVKPFQLDMALALRNIAIQPFQSYFERFASIAVDDGALDLDGKIHLAVEHPKTPLMTFQGNVGVKSLAIADRDRGAPVASWKQFQLRQIALAVDPTSVTIEEVGLDQPTVHLAILADGQVNLKKLLPHASAADSPPAAEQPVSQPKKGPPPSITIKTVKLLKGTATFQDESITPPVQTGLYDLTGTVKGLSSKHIAKAVVDLSGKVDKVAPLKITGTINPLTEDAFTDLAIKFDNVDLTVATPYSGKYAGYPIRKGKLFLDMAYKVSQKQLEAENKLAIDQLTFGEKTNSPDATSLPVPLAVALLKDRKGRIDIDLPIRGDLKDQDFKYGKVVLSSLVNLLTKLVASPFTLMGTLVSGGGDAKELQHLVFEPGSTAIAPAELKKIDVLMKGLEERPGLRLEITGVADPARDRQALARQLFYEELRRRWRQGRGSSHKDAVLPPQEEERLIKELFDQRHSHQVVPQQQPNVSLKPPTTEEMRRELLASITVEDSALRALARQRAEQLQAQMVGEGKLAEERVFLTEVEITAEGDEKIRTRLNITAGS